MPDKYIILTLVAIATLQISNNFQKQEQNTFKTQLSFKKFLFFSFMWSVFIIHNDRRP